MDGQREVATQAYARWAMLSRPTQTGLDLHHHSPPPLELPTKTPGVWKSTPPLPGGTKMLVRGRAIQVNFGKKDARTQTPLTGITKWCEQKKGRIVLSSSHQMPTPLTNRPHPNDEDNGRQTAQMKTTEVATQAEPSPSISDTVSRETSTPSQEVKPTASFWDPSEENKEYEELHFGPSTVSDEILHELEMESIYCATAYLETKRRKTDPSPHSSDDKVPRTTSGQLSGTDDPRIPHPLLDTSDPLGLLQTTEDMIDLFFK